MAKNQSLFVMRSRLIGMPFEQLGLSVQKIFIRSENIYPFEQMLLLIFIF